MLAYASLELFDGIELVLLHRAHPPFHAPVPEVVPGIAHPQVVVRVNLRMPR